MDDDERDGGDDEAAPEAADRPRMMSWAEVRGRGGFRCPECKCPETRVVKTRPVRAGDANNRRRECAHCGHRFTTREDVI